MQEEKKEKSKEISFYFCKHCGKIISIVQDSGVPTICCGEEMKKLEAGTTDGAQEKHVPVIDDFGTSAIVTVGSVLHPMTPEHSIKWIILETNKGFYTKKLCPENKPHAIFYIGLDEEIRTAFCYCNIHGLWKSEETKICLN